jgi:hypothetical protein
MQHEPQRTWFAGVIRIHEIFEGWVVVAKWTQCISLSVPASKGESDKLKRIEWAHCTTVQFDVTTLREAVDLLTGWAEETCRPSRDVAHVALALATQAQRFPCMNPYIRN